MTKIANDNSHIIKAGATIISGLFLATAIGCTSRDNRLEDWSPTYAQQCASLGEESDLGLGHGTDAQNRLREIKSIWEQTDEGWAWKDHIIKNDTAFCFGDPISETSPIGIDGKADAYIIDEDLSNAHVARSILTGKTAKEYNKAVEWSEDYKAADALLWSRAMSGHKINIELSQSYEMADRSFHSDVWKDTENDPYIQREAKIFRYIIEEGKSVAQAHIAVLADYLEDNQALATKDRSFLKWYDKFLHERTELRASFCWGFDGSLEPCLSTETIVPGKNVAASNLSSGALEQLSGIYTNTPYLNTSDANHLLANDSYKTIDVSIASDFGKVKNNAERCCGENRSNNSNGLFGLSFSGKFGIAF